MAPERSSFFSTRSAIVDFPEPESPVNHSTQGCCPFNSARVTFPTESACQWRLLARRSPNCDHAGRHRVVGEAVDQDEAAGLGFLGVEDRRRATCRSGLHRPTSFSSKSCPRHASRFSTLSLYLRLEMVAVVVWRPHLMVGAAGQHRLLVEPHDTRGDLVGNPRAPPQYRKRSSPRLNIDFLGKAQRDARRRDAATSRSPSAVTMRAT